MDVSSLDFIGTYGGYNIYTSVSDKDVAKENGVGNTAIVVSDGSDFATSIGTAAYGIDYIDMMYEIHEKNLDYIVEQLSSGEVVSNIESGDTVSDIEEDSEALGDADPEIFGSYSGNGIDVTIGLGSDSFEITMTGAETFNGPLSWLADDLYDCRVDETWLQVQLVDSNTITIRSSYLPLEGTYTRE